jgi:hypothetical protein
MVAIIFVDSRAMQDIHASWGVLLHLIGNVFAPSNQPNGPQLCRSSNKPTEWFRLLIAQRAIMQR